MQSAPTTSPTLDKVDLRLIAILLLICAATLGFAWIGYLDSDDKLMFRGAVGWLNEFPYVGQTHHEVRHFVTVPMALSMRVFGVNETGIIVPTVLYFVGIVICTYFGVKHIADRASALLATVLLATLSLFATRATIPDADITMLFFLVTSIWLFIFACDRQKRTGYLFASGVMAGCAWLTKETTSALLIFYGLLFLLGYRIPRRQYWIMAAGFLLILFAETAYMYFSTGQPFYRYVLALTAVDVWPAAAEGGEGFDNIGNVRIHPVIDPLLVLFANNDFSLLFYFSLPAAWWVLKGRFQKEDKRRGFSLLILGLGLIWFIAIVLLLSKFLHPRYFCLTAYLATIVLALWIRYDVWFRSRIVASLIVVLLLTSNLASIYVGNRDPLFGERALREFAAQSEEVIYTDHLSHRRARFLLETQGLSDSVKSEGKLPAEALFFHNPNRTEYPLEKFDGPKDLSTFPVVWSKQDNRKFIGIALEALGIDGYVPAHILRRLNRPNETVSIYRVSPSSFIYTKEEQ